jgi:23S rRNA pseudouridine1911/1915/1917 synthase
VKELADRPVPHRIRSRWAGLTLIEYVQRVRPAIVEAELRQHIAEGKYRLRDGPVLSAEDIVEADTTLLVDVPLKLDGDPFLPTPTGPLQVLMQDEHMLVVNKPPGLLSYPMGPRKIAVLSLAERQLEQAGEEPELRPLHRLDRETSGVLMMARNKRADRRVKKQFQKKRIDKSYLAIVRGNLVGGVQILHGPIGPDANSEIRIRMAVRDDGKPAETWTRNLGTFGDTDWGEAGRGYTWVECRPRTGRTHQIRVHLASRGHPLVGDKVYCDGGRAFLRRWDGLLDADDIEQLGHPRQTLHAWTLNLQHPESNEPLELRAPIPPDLVEFARSHGGDLPPEVSR